MLVVQFDCCVCLLFGLFVMYGCFSVYFLSMVVAKFI